MLYVLSKIGEAIIQPSMMLLAILILGTLLFFVRRSSRIGPALIAVGVAGMAACALLPVGTWLLQPLEDQFPTPAIPARVDGIVVLGGAISLGEGSARGTVPLNSHAERMTEFVTLAFRYPRAQLVFTGGDPSISGRGPTEALFARELFTQLGIDPRRIIFESRSRNTRENALFSFRLVKPKPGANWLLVTSAPDMPRAVGCFRVVGWTVIPVPVDYNTQPGVTGWVPGITYGLEHVDWAAHEWAGLLYYRLQGWTPTLLPSFAKSKTRHLF